MQTNMQTNCVNCGAPLKDQKCEYCRTEYIIHEKTDNSELNIGQQILAAKTLGIQRGSGIIATEVKNKEKFIPVKFLGYKSYLVVYE